MTRERVITKAVLIISFVSLLNDVASELLYPVMPIYLREIGFSVLLIGIIEGVAEAIAGLGKGYFGAVSDRVMKRAIFVRAGYTFSAISKPLMAILSFPAGVLFSRSMDKFGKALRTGARDAMLSAETRTDTKATVFGFHRAMDTTGAVIGPCIGLIYLTLFPANYTHLILLTFVPGLLCVALTMFLTDKPNTAPSGKPYTPLLHSLRYIFSSNTDYRTLVAGLILFGLFNSSDVFLLMRMKESGASDTTVIGSYIFYNLIFAAAAYPLGRLADKIGLKKIFIAGLILFSIVYAGFAFAGSAIVFSIMLLCYGLYSAATEGISRAWIAKICKPSETATALGAFSGYQSLSALFASSVAGWVWYTFGAQTTFLCTSIFSLIAATYLFFAAKEPKVEVGD